MSLNERSCLAGGGGGHPLVVACVVESGTRGVLLLL